MKILVSILVFWGIFLSATEAQMINGNDTLYGNEWINHNQTYLKIEISEDGIYRIPFATLNQAGVPLTTIQGANFQLFSFGNEVPILTSSNGLFSTNDYIEFFGEKNRSRLDSFLFTNPTTNLLNPYYSMFTDTTAYYLTWNAAVNGLRYQNINNNLANAPAKEDYFMFDFVQEYHSSFIKKRAGGYIYDSRFEVEGFGHSASNNRTIDYSINHIYAAGPSSRATVQLAVVEDGTHHQIIRINGTTYIDDNFGGFVLKSYAFDVPTAPLTSTLQLNTQNDFNNKDKSSLAIFRYTYPHTFKN